MVDAVNAGTTAGSASAAMKQTMGMNKDDFLTLFVTQLQNQDPLNPMDGTQFISQLAQLTQVEQAYNTNSNLEKLISMMNDSSALSSLSYIGKEVIAAGSQVALTSGGEANLSCVLPKAAEQVVVEIYDSGGTTVRTLTQGQTAAGPATLVWDGRNDAGTALPSGTYSFAVKGIDSSGNTFTCETRTGGKVDGVSFSGSSPVLTVGALEIPFSSLLSVKGGS
ncbi:MAG: flagellar hook assembly protein FlgD [Geobacteraceae bacterium]|nr:flagellar hook assembly protein FlgD [Geobacteraceae bacterium]